MENNMQKPMSDLERIQQSYTSGGQTYAPPKDDASLPAKRSEGPQSSTRYPQSRTPLQG
jgi:hypothetical protein